MPPVPAVAAGASSLGSRGRSGRDGKPQHSAPRALHADPYPHGDGSFRRRACPPRCTDGCGSVTETVPANNSATDNTTLTPHSNLSITKTDSQTTAVPGVATSYPITVGTAGPSCEPAASVVDNFSAAPTGATWTCAASRRASCGAPSGSGNIATTANLSSGGSVTYAVSATIDDGAGHSSASSASVQVRD